MFVSADQSIPSLRIIQATRVVGGAAPFNGSMTIPETATETRYSRQTARRAELEK